MSNMFNKKAITDTEEKLEENNENIKCMEEETEENRITKLKKEVQDIAKHNDSKSSETLSEHYYPDKEGHEYLRVIRRTGKPKFVIQHWENGKWEKGYGGNPKIPYRLPELIEAKRSNKSSIFIVSGEKDADAIVETNLGFVATTTMTSSKSKWEFDFSNEYISRDTKVIIIEDDSEYGREFAEKTSQTLEYGHESCIYEIKELKKILDINDNTVTDIAGIKERLTEEEFIDLLKTLEETAINGR